MTTPVPPGPFAAQAPSAPLDHGAPDAAAATSAWRRALAAAGLVLAAACGGAETDRADVAAWWSAEAGAGSGGDAEAEAGAAVSPASDAAAVVDGAGSPGAGAARQSGVATAAPAPLAPDDEPAPALAAPGSAPEQAWRELTARHTWLYRHPDPAGLDLLYAPECPCLADEREQLAGLTAQERWWTGARPELTAVEVRDAAAPDLVVLRATYARRGEAQLVDAGGAVHQTVPARDPIVIDIVLVREDASAPWRVRALSEQGSTPGATP